MSNGGWRDRPARPEDYEDKPECCECRQVKQVDDQCGHWQVNKLRTVATLDVQVRDRLARLKAAGPYLCGDCFFELTDMD